LEGGCQQFLPGVAYLAADHQSQPRHLAEGRSHYDLAIVAAILAAQGTFRVDELCRTVLTGRAGVGRPGPANPWCLACRSCGPAGRFLGEAKLVAGIDVFGIASITQLVALLQGESMPVVDPIEVMGDPAGKHAKRRLDLASRSGGG
jgi:magnesium chelatase family protein